MPNPETILGLGPAKGRSETYKISASFRTEQNDMHEHDEHDKHNETKEL